uniref:Uncharacterized protein n=1 Tax=Grammatophora oceanica TaxID=210454 RepID=A0A7S1UZP1_9STRA|mmetsp:Transcript_3124/g.4295  ORF Transcript_3124/g.4295 Transcript_3124/m.4295 type:complete len:174 (+) Transcript_3124:251-772(+)
MQVQKNMEVSHLVKVASNTRAFVSFVRRSHCRRLEPSQLEECHRLVPHPRDKPIQPEETLGGILPNPNLLTRLYGHNNQFNNCTRRFYLSNSGRIEDKLAVSGRYRYNLHPQLGHVVGGGARVKFMHVLQNQMFNQSAPFGTVSRKKRSLCTDGKTLQMPVIPCNALWLRLEW